MGKEEPASVVFDRAGKVGILKLNRPEILNCLNYETLKELRRFLEVIKEDKRIRVVLICGEGRAFSTGMDLKSTKDKSTEELRKINYYGLVETFAYLQHFPKPTIAVIDGYALGGGFELALSCDFRFASRERAVFGFPEINLGILPTWGGMFLPIELIGVSRTMELVLTGNRINAETAYNLGLLNQVVPHADLFETALSFAKSLARKGSFLLQLAKYTIQNSATASQEKRLQLTSSALDLLTAGGEREEQLVSLLARSEMQIRGKKNEG